MTAMGTVESAQSETTAMAGLEISKILRRAPNHGWQLTTVVVTNVNDYLWTPACSRSGRIPELVQWPTLREYHCD